MATIEQQAGRTIFGNDPEQYAEARPEYPVRVYEVLRTTCQSGPSTRVFEIGAGTGQASIPVLDLGCHLTVIEPDPRLAAVLARSISGANAARLRVLTVPFETVELPEGSFDLGIAATSFHWLDQKSALHKVIRLLRPGGWWAMWWTVFGDPEQEDEFQRRTHALFEELDRSPSHGDRPNVPFALDAEKRVGDLQAVGFESISSEVIRWTVSRTTKQELALTATYSPVARLPDTERTQFLEKIRRIVNDDFGGNVSRNFVTVIYTAARAPL